VEVRFVENVRAPIEEVFDFGADPRNASAALPPGTSVDVETLGRLGIGTVVTFSRSGKTVNRSVVTEYERPNRFALTSGRLRMVDTLVQHGPVTTVISELSWPYVNAPPWAWPILIFAAPLLLDAAAEMNRRGANAARAALEEPGSATVPGRWSEPWASRRRRVWALLFGGPAAVSFVVAFALAWISP
jgi:hypothetical protein